MDLREFKTEINPVIPMETRDGFAPMTSVSIDYVQIYRALRFEIKSLQLFGTLVYKYN